MTTTGFSRRQLLTLAGVTLGVGVVELAAPATPASAAPTDPPAGTITLEPVADHPVAVLSGDGAAPAACPRQLAVRVSTSVALPAGTTLAVTYDPRLFAPVTPAVATLGRRLVAAGSATTPATAGQRTCTVTLREAVPASGGAAGDLVVLLATARRLTLPHDLVRRPGDAVADLAAAGRTNRVHRNLRPQRPPAFGGPSTPWGVELTGGWSRHSWDADRCWYWYPTLVSLRGVGPGAAPVGAEFTLAVDPQVVRDVAVAWVRLNRRTQRGGVRLAATTRTGALYQTRWRSAVRLKPGDVLEVGFTAATHTPAGPLETIKHPLVALAMGTDPAQRDTGALSFTRSDASWQ